MDSFIALTRSQKPYTYQKIELKRFMFASEWEGGIVRVCEGMGVNG